MDIINVKKDLDENSYIIHAINSYLKGQDLESFFPNKPVNKIKEIIDSNYPNITDETIDNIKNLVFKS